MKRIIYLLLFVSAFAVSTHAQVMIGTDTAPNKNAVLELKSDTLGFLPPRVALTALGDPAPLKATNATLAPGMVVFNTTLDPSKSLFPGLHYYSGVEWVRLARVPKGVEWFYMPSVKIDTKEIKSGYKVELYDEYKNQFAGAKRSETTAPDLPVVANATDLYYYVFCSNDGVFGNVSVNANGTLTYDVKQNATDETFMNIIFVVK